MKQYKIRNGPEESYFCPVKKSLTLSQKLLDDIEKVMALERVDNLSWMVRRLLRLSIERYQKVPDEIRLGRTTFTVTPMLPLSEVLLLVAERLNLPPAYIICKMIEKGINEWVERTNSSTKTLEELREKMQARMGHLYQDPIPTTLIEEEDMAEENLEIDDAEAY